MKKISPDAKTAKAFATSWNNLPEGPIYTFNQFAEWMRPLRKSDFKNKRVLELGCGNASLMIHIAKWTPKFIEGIDLGDSVKSAIRNMNKQEFTNWRVKKKDLMTYKSGGFDVVYCIGVLHHLKDPYLGFKSVIRNVKEGGKFHCWVYAREGNGLVIYFVEPIRKIVSKLPWWFTKFFVAFPLSLPFYLYANLISFFSNLYFVKKLPLHKYCLWISKRGYPFFLHVVFDQLVTPHTVYIDKDTIKSWLTNNSQIRKSSTYLLSRNANSWKFGGRVK